MKFKQLIANAQLPKRQKTGDAGFDLHAVRDSIITHLSIIDTGVAVEIPFGFVGLIRDRSGLAAKHGIRTLAGVIDSGYTGEIKVVMQAPCDHIVKAGDRIAQLIVVPCLMEDSEWGEIHPGSERGAGGLGSTGL